MTHPPVCPCIRNSQLSTFHLNSSQYYSSTSSTPLPLFPLPSALPRWLPLPSTLLTTNRDRVPTTISIPATHAPSRSLLTTATAVCCLLLFLCSESSDNSGDMDAELK
ncbi:hypothetical protein EX30DRAFT_14238 [Ascodesmis nigricans]|uniref:Uncharacterized protein n=1 Tax=Ascodesmis nigricans TaxID=341454 RepID=A0A4S2N6V9_9PEZI|nr:hypothetical protein EX30DRAFT_14238 [Ascodesmis nigricans]